MSRKQRRNVHVLPAGRTARNRPAFIARVAGSSVPLTPLTTRRDAIAAAMGEARERRSEVVIHRADGRIRDTDSYGPDSPDVRDTKH